MLAIGVTFSGCAGAGDPFDPRAGAYALHPGRNAIEGQAEARGPAGSDRSCAGAFATLMPVTPATTRRLDAIYGGGRAVSFAEAPHLPPDPALDAVLRRARCDAHGRFRFRSLADGAYYLVAPLRARGEGPREGLSVRGVASVRNGATRRVALRP